MEKVNMLLHIPHKNPNVKSCQLTICNSIRVVRQGMFSKITIQYSGIATLGSFRVSGFTFPCLSRIESTTTILPIDSQEQRLLKVQY